MGIDQPTGAGSNGLRRRALDRDIAVPEANPRATLDVKSNLRSRSRELYKAIPAIVWLKIMPVAIRATRNGVSARIRNINTVNANKADARAYTPASCTFILKGTRVHGSKVMMRKCPYFVGYNFAWTLAS